jgi:hypothetical protein
MAVTSTTCRNLVSNGVLPGSIHPFLRSQPHSRAGQDPSEAASLASFLTIGFPDLLGKPYNDTWVSNHDGH